MTAGSATFTWPVPPIAMEPSFDELGYLATPYTHYKKGREEAFLEACSLAGRLIRCGMRVFSPVAHSHSIAVHSGLDPVDHDLWFKLDLVFCRKAGFLMVAHMEGWEESCGVQREIEFFESENKLIYDLFVDAGALYWRRR